MKVKSKTTGKVYTGVIGYNVRDDGKGVIWIDNKILVTYSDVEDIKTLKRLFQEDYEVLSN